MRSIISALALLFIAATSAAAQGSTGYTGEIRDDGNGRYEVIVVKRGDTIWGLCMRRDWCRHYYPEVRKDWADFLGAVSNLNGKDMNRLAIGERIKFPVPVGVADEFNRLDSAIAEKADLAAGLEKTAQQLRNSNTLLSGKVAEQQGIIASLKATVAELTGKIAGLTKVNGELQQSVTTRNWLLFLAIIGLIIGTVGLIFFSRQDKQIDRAFEGRPLPQAIRPGTR